VDEPEGGGEDAEEKDVELAELGLEIRVVVGVVSSSTTSTKVSIW